MTTETPITPASSIHSQIMNLPCHTSRVVTVVEQSIVASKAYEIGHRDARHAAAELGAKADATIRQLLAACDDVDCPCSPRERESGHRIGCFMPDFKDAIAKAIQQQGAPCPFCKSTECKTIIATDNGTHGIKRAAGCLERQAANDEKATRATGKEN